jgi:hypothetical protein
METLTFSSLLTLLSIILYVFVCLRILTGTQGPWEGGGGCSCPKYERRGKEKSRVQPEAIGASNPEVGSCSSVLVVTLAGA